VQVYVRNAERLSQEQIQDFLKSSEPIDFVGSGRDEKYAWMECVLRAQNYGDLGKGDRGVVRAYVEKLTGMSAAQMTRLIRGFLDQGVVRAAPYERHRFRTLYTPEDVGLLAEVDRVHERLSGPATRYLLRRASEQYGDPRYARLAKISVAHLYNLRASARYRNQAAVFEPTRPAATAIGERRRPDPHGRPGFLRVDTVHQGDWDGAKGVYHINAVDTVTPWQVVGCASKISECRSQDNALVEGKNGAVVRKLIGYGHIASEHAAAIGNFYARHLNPYLNFHRPCGFATVTLDERGKRRRQYKSEDYRTPFEKLKSLDRAAEYLKPGLSLAELERVTHVMSDTESARQMSAAKSGLRGRPRRS
jgi:hypothetical protein